MRSALAIWRGFKIRFIIVYEIIFKNKFIIFYINKIKIINLINHFCATACGVVVLQYRPS
jgi:hypothetical protein